MMRLWKGTFHDTDSYISLVFNTYFKRDNVFVRYEGDTLSAALLCVPYEFKIDSKNLNTPLNGMYLCGLATRPEFRRRGIMAQLMNEAEESIAARGYDMTFLIPADDHLREYYKRMGYYNASYKKISTYISNPGNRSSELYIYAFRDLIQSGDTDFIRDIATWCINVEKHKFTDPCLIHSERDMLAVISENENSIFVSNEPIDLKYPILTKVVSVVFPEIIVDSSGIFNVRITGLYLNNENYYFKSGSKEIKLEEIAEEICHFYKISKLEFDLANKIKLGRRIGENPYAMVKPISNLQIFFNNKKPIFEISLMLD
ncbi:MAG: GNAT family N-acetyltransferase [Muribaculaceae bacterium]|nr:GNAT family N-acetyltransferase [Muribaculaceae bacterium]